MNFLISYDISNDRQRLRASQILEDYGDRIQRSVFELPDLDEAAWGKCWTRLQRRVELESGDSIRVYFLCEKCRKAIRIWSPDGGEAMVPEPSVLIV